MAHMHPSADTGDMSRCACPAASLTSLQFADGVVMLRCGAHEHQEWFIDGRPAQRHEVLPALKDVFVGRRGERSSSRRHAVRRSVVRQPQPTSYEQVPTGAAATEQLNALLRARGLSGTWSVS